MMSVQLGETIVFVTTPVLAIFQKYRQLQKAQPERGGIVLGQVNLEENRVLVSRASVPTIHDTSTRHSLQRSKAWAQQVVDYEFQNSGGKNTYLGEWHTHPVKQAIPSSQDISMLKEQFRANEIRTRLLLLFVVAKTELAIVFYDGQKFLGTTVPSFF